MQFTQKTVLGLFDNSQKTFTIPVYQRAYSWGIKECNTFLDDLKEQIKGDNNYFLGNLLLETIKKDIEYEIIDGQQRLTTVTIFMRAVINVLNERIKDGEKIKIKTKDKVKLYLKNGDIKLQPVQYDRACYVTLIVDGKDNFQISTPSQKRIKEAKEFFIKELKKENTNTILKILQKLEETDVMCIEMPGKKDAALLFELQNNRGIDLTNMEKLKAFLMYQMYAYSKKDETESNIYQISDLFKAIYLLINDIKNLNEDSILIYHCNAYLNGFNYRTIDDIKQTLKRVNDSIDKVIWIKNFVEQLHTSFSNIKKLENYKDPYLSLMKKLSMPAFVYPFILKGFDYYGDDKKKLSMLFHILEIIVFRYELVNTSAYIISRLHDILVNFNGDLESLKNNIKIKFNNEYFWSDERVKNTLNGYMYHHPVLKYLLWRYEDSIPNKGYKGRNVEITNEEIEHISPQTPKENEPPLEYGYDVDENNNYDEEFIEDYLNALGNLLIISSNHNKVIGNKRFSLKLDSYNTNPLSQQREIKNFIKNIALPMWDKEAIDKRQDIILDFAVNNWDFDSINIL